MSYVLCSFGAHACWSKITVCLHTLPISSRAYIMYEKSDLFILDTGNGCERGIGNAVLGVEGHARTA